MDKSAEKKQHEDDAMIDDLLMDLMLVRNALDKAIEELEDMSDGGQGDLRATAQFVHGFLKDGKRYSEATKYFFA